MSLPTRKIGDSKVTAIGFGAMGIAAFYSTTLSEEDRMKVCALGTGALSNVYAPNLLTTVLTAPRRIVRERMYQLGHCRLLRRQRSIDWEMVCMRHLTSCVFENQ